jgi:hypothetical protein
MNKENAKDYLHLVQALADGKTIQFKTTSGNWEDQVNLHFSLDPEDYRIKPEPRTWKVWAHKNDNDIVASMPTAWNTDNTWKRITVQEVLE